MQEEISFPKTVPRTVILTGKPFPVLEENGVPKSLSLALEYLGKNGYVFNLTDFTEARIDIFNMHKDPETTLKHSFWSDWYTTLTEEISIRDILLTFHGGYIFNTPTRIRQAINQGLVNGKGRLSDEEIKTLKEGIITGKIPDTQIPVIPFGDFIKYTQSQISELPRPYGVSMPLKEAQSLESKAHPLNVLEKSNLFKVRAGGNDQAKTYLETLTQLGVKNYGNRHSFQEGVGLLLVVDNLFDYGFYGNLRLGGYARFFGVSSDAEGVAKISTPNLDERLNILNEAEITSKELRKALDLYKAANLLFKRTK